MIDRHSLIYDSLPITDEEIKENSRFADIAASIQKVTEEILIKMANYLYQKQV